MIIVKKIKQMIITKKKINFFLYAKKSCKKLKLKDLAEWILEDNLPVRLHTQLHKYIWDPKTIGV